MVTINLSTSVKGIDQRAWFPMADLIMRFLLQNGNIGDVRIYNDAIYFYRFALFKKGEIKYENNDFEVRSGIIYYTGTPFKSNLKCEAFIYLVNILRQLKPGYMAKLPI